MERDNWGSEMTTPCFCVAPNWEGDLNALIGTKCMFTSAFAASTKRLSGRHCVETGGERYVPTRGGQPPFCEDRSQRTMRNRDAEEEGLARGRWTSL